MKKINVYVLSGFLGSGKTTLLREFISYEKNAGRLPAVLMNELGSVSIDSDAIDKGTPFTEMLDGCICCTIQEKLEAQLQELLFNYSFDTLIIETTGAAHPVEVVDSIMSPLFADRFDFKGIVTIVDALRWKKRADLSPQVLHLLREQIKHASLILLNKVDLINEMESGTFVFEMQQLNAEAKVLLTKHSQINFVELDNLERIENKKYEPSQLNKNLSLQSMVYTFHRPIELEEFEDWLKSMPDTIFRLKGYILFQHSSLPYSFQYSYGMPIYLKEEMKMPLNLVIIGEGLNKDRIRKELGALEK
ncbi:CobW family GTP-binding protein [Falsibacillus albus]|uniref:GTP-binding protein n=1 Tax=Falsibacillus albus TaxID=2478915 RepID=A0A3L7JZV2_9BACI|nr:GTP-binding protein [Falsibacillus albus]RLQ95211.1 GTP-binding protein [Falsibacillus albus]